MPDESAKPTPPQRGGLPIGAVRSPDGLGPMTTLASPHVNARLDVRPQSKPTTPGIWGAVVASLTAVGAAFAAGTVVLPIPWLAPVIGIVLLAAAGGIGTWAGVKSAGSAKVVKDESEPPQ